MNTTNPDISIAKQRGKPFTKGVSGNPAGKPPGTKSKGAAIIEALLQNPEDVKAIIDRTVALAKSGEGWATTLLLARLWPAPKSRRVTFPMREIKCLADISAAYNGLMQATGQGLLTPTEANELSSIIERMAGALDLSETERRLAALEKAARI